MRCREPSPLGYVPLAMEPQRDSSADAVRRPLGSGARSKRTPLKWTPQKWTLGAAATAVLGAGLIFPPAAAGPRSGAGSAFATQQEDVQAAFAKGGLIVDIDAKTVAFPADIEVRHDNLEYLLVNPHGAVHEALFVTPTDASLLAAAFLAVGAEAGSNVVYTAVDPPPTQDEVRAGARTHDVEIPRGKPIYLHAAWKEAAGAIDEGSGKFPETTVHFHRLEDLVVDLERDRTMRRHGLVWLGSRTIPGRNPGDAERFAAQAAGNLLCVSFFSDGDTLLTTALPECVSQTAWIPNGWLMPQSGSEVLLIASLTPLDRVPSSLESALPLVPEPDRR